ncbi:MAG TPA: sulfite exporter TauE/SafE family protein [Crenotrichaceae bacterium]|nr:sulfite exporter TauE/SafE family protein [Crenotrichaceae bacterium]
MGYSDALLAGILFLVAVVFSMLGQGGGTLYTPVQVLFGIDFHVAATTSLFLIMVASLSSTLVFRKAKKVDWSLAIVLETVTTLGGFIGGLVSGGFSAQTLTWVFSGIVAFSAIFMIHDFKHSPESVPTNQRWFDWHRRFDGRHYTVNLLLALPVSFVAGLSSGLIGVGGGILKVPLMVLLLGIPMDIAVGSSALMVGLTASGGFAGHLAAGHWDWKTSLLLGVAVFIGGQIGARKALSLDKKKMKKLFGWFLLLIALVMVIKNSPHPQIDLLSPCGWNIPYICRAFQ